MNCTHCKVAIHCILTELSEWEPDFCVSIQSFSCQSLVEFEMKWRHWQDECVQRLEQGMFAAESNLENICKVCPLITETVSREII